MILCHVDSQAEELIYLEWTFWAATWTVKGEGSSKCGVFWWRYSRGVPGIHLIISCKSLSWVAITYLKNKYMRLKLGEQVPNFHDRCAVYTTKQEPFDESFCKKYKGNIDANLDYKSIKYRTISILIIAY